MGEVLLHIRIRDAHNGRTIHSLAFAEEHAGKEKWIKESSVGVGLVKRTVVLRPDAERALMAIKSTIKLAAAGEKAN